MLKRRFLLLGSAIVVLLVFAVTTSSYACTDFQVKTEDGGVVIGRSMEFAVELNAALNTHPAGEKRQSQAPNGKPGLGWTSQYGFVSVNSLGYDSVVDGMNEAGLSVGFLWLPEITHYQDVADNEISKAILIDDLGAWILGNFSKVGEVKQALLQVRVWGKVVPELGMIPPLHIAVHDADGNNLVVEFINGRAKIYDNPIGVLTNTPTFDWHLTNLRNYVNLTSFNENPKTLAGMTLKPMGSGSGLLGLPGDSTPPSRFVRAVAYAHFAEKAKTSQEGINLAAHILNTVDIPRGTIKEKTPTAVLEDYTQWAVIKDLKDRVFYFRTYDNLELRSVDLKKINFRAPGPRKAFALKGAENGAVDITSRIS